MSLVPTGINPEGETVMSIMTGKNISHCQYYYVDVLVLLLCTLLKALSNKNISRAHFSLLSKKGDKFLGCKNARSEKTSSKILPFEIDDLYANELQGKK